MIEICFSTPGAHAGIVPDAEMTRQVVTPVQTHGCNVAVIGREGAFPSLDDTDALISFRGGVAIGVKTADCVPVLLHAPDIKAVAAVHAGWKGSLHGIVSATLDRLRELGADLSLTQAAFGPSICGGCYQVSEELAAAFGREGFPEAIIGERNLDLEMVNRLRLISAGVNDDNITGGGRCTFETTWLPSWRREQTSRRLLSWIMLD